MTETENNRRNELLDKRDCAYIFGKVKGKKFVCDPDFPWTPEMTRELADLDAKFEAKHGKK